MISIWHLLWIVPLSASLGVAVMCLMQINGGEEDGEDYDEMSDLL